MCVCAKGKAPPLPTVALWGEVVEWVSKFKYMGTLMSSSMDILIDVQARVVKVIGTFASLKPILLNKAINLGIWMLFYMAFIPPTFMFGCECWALKPAMASHLEATHMSFMHSMLGVNLLDKIHNAEILPRCEMLSIAYTINWQQMQWLNHLARMELNKLPKQIFQGKLPKGKRGRGRPPTSIQKGYKDDVASMSTTGGGHFHATREGQTFWDNAQDKAVWKGLINAMWAIKANRGKALAGKCCKSMGT
jgi:hypothetical protein